MYHLYGRPGAGNVAVEAILEIAGAPYKREILERDANNKFPASFTKLNPMEQVPTLVLPGGEVMTESAAICIYLADQFPAARLAPAANDAKRPAFLRWMVFLAANVYMSDLRYFYSDRYTTDGGGAAGVKASAAAAMERELAVYAGALGNNPYILGEAMSAADVYAAMLVSWSPDLPALWAKHANLKAMYDRVTAHPKVSEVWKRNEM